MPAERRLTAAEIRRKVRDTDSFYIINCEVFTVNRPAFSAIVSFFWM